ncbi:MAG: hypothetical protein HKN12_04200, partial [Gemmatimonadetes bacterium]|nr:hypothetical protein [Gemmatimonadota bacterium]
IYVVHMNGTLLAGLALVGCLRPLLRWKMPGAVAAVLLGAAVLAVPVAERMSYLQRNADLTRQIGAGWEAEGAQLTQALDLAAQDRTGRVYAGQGSAGGNAWGGRFQVGWIPVYAWFPPREMEALGYLHHMWSMNSDFQSAFDERNPIHYRVFNVSRIIAPPDVRFGSFARPLQQFGRFRVLAVDGPGYVELVDVPFEVEIPKSHVARAHRAWLGRLAPLRIHPRWTVVEADAAPTELTRLDKYDISFPAVKPPGGRRGEVLSVEREADDFVAHVDAERACHVLLKMTYHPGWKATVDGAPVEPVQLFPSYLGVPVGPGEHRVEFRWAPGNSKTWLALAGIGILTAFAAISRRIRI